MARDDWFFILEPDGTIVRCRQSESGNVRWEVEISWSDLQAKYPNYATSVAAAAEQAGVVLK